MREIKSGSKWLIITVISLAMAFLSAQTVEVFGGSWLNSPWGKGEHKADESKTSASGAASPMKQAAHDEQIVQAVTGTSTVTKLFWVDYGVQNDSSNAILLYVDPAAVTPTKVLYDSGIFVGSGMRNNNSGNDLQRHTFVTGTVNTTTYQMTNLQP